MAIKNIDRSMDFVEQAVAGICENLEALGVDSRCLEGIRSEAMFLLKEGQNSLNIKAISGLQLLTQRLEKAVHTLVQSQLADWGVPATKN